MTEGQAFLTGGADEIYLVDEVPNERAAQRLAQLWQQSDLQAIARDRGLSAAFLEALIWLK